MHPGRRRPGRGRHTRGRWRASAQPLRSRSAKAPLRPGPEGRPSLGNASSVGADGLAHLRARAGLEPQCWCLGRLPVWKHLPLDRPGLCPRVRAVPQGQGWGGACPNARRSAVMGSGQPAGLVSWASVHGQTAWAGPGACAPGPSCPLPAALSQAGAHRPQVVSIREDLMAGFQADGVEGESNRAELSVVREAQRRLEGLGRASTCRLSGCGPGCCAERPQGSFSQVRFPDKRALILSSFGVLLKTQRTS